MDGYDDRSWHLDKRIPVAIIATLLVQTAGIVWWASNLNARVELLEMQVRPTLDRMRMAEDRQVRNDVRLDALYRRLEAIERKLDSLIESRKP